MKSAETIRTGEAEEGRKKPIYLKRDTDRYMEFANTQKGLFFAVLLSLPLWGMIIFMIINKVHL